MVGRSSETSAARRRLERLQHVGLADLEQLGDLGYRRRALELVAELRDRALDRADALLEAARHPQRPDAVAEVAAQLAEDRRPGEGRERDAALGVEALERRDEAEAGDLDQVLARLDPAAVAHREAAGEGQEAADELLAGVLVAGAGVAFEQLGFHRRARCRAAGGGRSPAGRRRWRRSALIGGSRKIGDARPRTRFRGESATPR